MKKFISIIISALILCAVCAFCGCASSNVDYDNESAYTVGGGEITANITEIEINWVEEGVEVKYGDGDKLIISESADKTVPEKLQLRYLVVGQTLTIQFASNGRHDIVGLNKNLTVTIPQGTQLDRLSVDSVSGDVTADVEVKDLEVDIVSGSVTANKVSRRAEVDTVSGSVNLYTGSVTEIEVESTSGNINLFVPEDMGFTLDFDSVSGDFNSSLETTRRGKSYTRLGGGARISVETTSGGLTIEKNA